MIRLFHASDLHFGKEDSAALEWFAAAVSAEKPDAVLITGDLTMRARAREFAAATSWLCALDAPVSVEMGNHDMPYFSPWGRMVSPYARYERLERMVERPFDLDGVAIVPLRTASRAQLRLNWAHGIARERLVAGTAAQVRAAREGAIRIVTCHHPLIGKDARKNRTRGGLSALHALSEAGCHAVLSGHVHDPFDIHWQGKGGPVRLIGAGTLSERVRATPPSFNQIDVAGGGLTVRVRTMS